MSTLLANPVEMIARGAPHIIHNDEELRAYSDALFELTALEETTADQDEAIELLTLLITSYENDHYPVPKVDPVSVVRFLMDQKGLKNKDLIPEFGTHSAVSMFLSGERQLTVKQIQALSARFHLSADAFLGS